LILITITNTFERAIVEYITQFAFDRSNAENLWKSIRNKARDQLGLPIPSVVRLGLARRNITGGRTIGDLIAVGSVGVRLCARQDGFATWGFFTNHGTRTLDNSRPHTVTMIVDQES